MFHLVATKNNLQWSDCEFEDNLSKLPLENRVEILPYKNWQDRQARVLSKLLLQYQLNHFNSGLDLSSIKKNDFNFPYVEGDFFYSVSHSHQLVVCLASNESKVGIDIEWTNTITEHYPLIIFSEEECNYLNHSTNLKADFYSLFTRKEAWAKLLQKGVYCNYKKYTLLNNQVLDDNELWQIESTLVEQEYAMSYITKNILSPIPVNYIQF